MEHVTSPSSSKSADGVSAVSRAERSRRTSELLLEAHSTNDADLRAALLDQVVLLNRGVAEAVANRYRGRGVPVEDLHQAAFEGLVKAVHRFDPTVRPDLLTYAVPTIRGQVQRWFRDQSWMIRPPRRLQELQWRVSRSVEALSHQLSREPTDAEVIDDVQCSKDELEATRQSYGCFQPPSLDRPTGDGTDLTIGETLATDDDRSTAEARATLGPVLRLLPERDRRLLFLRFFEGRSQSEIAEEFGVSQTQVSRLLERVLRDLRSRIA